MISIREGWCGVFAPAIRITDLSLHEDRITIVPESGRRVELEYSNVSEVTTWSSLLAVQLCLQVTDEQGSVYLYRLITWAWRSSEVHRIATIIEWEISEGWNRATQGKVFTMKTLSFIVCHTQLRHFRST